MKRHRQPSIVLLGFVLLATLLVAKVRGADATQPAWSPKAAAEYLDGRAGWWLNWSGAARGQGTVCVSCHTSMPFALARPALGKQLGETATGAVEKKLIDNVKKRVENWDQIVANAPGNDPLISFYSKNMKPSSLGTEAVLNALILVNYDARRVNGDLSASTQKALSHLWEQQKENGAWLWLDFGLNPWEKDGAYFGASLAAVAVGTAGKSYFDRADVQAKVTVLKKYLTTQSASQPLHHRVLGLWASSKLPGFLTEGDKKKLIEEILNLQETDGGWRLPKLGKTPGVDWKSHGGYPEGAVSDGYATGLVVLALKRAGVAADSPKLQKGIGWLVANQREGAWPASYLNKQRDPQENIGKVMRDAATAFAILALTEPTPSRLGNVGAGEPSWQGKTVLLTRAGVKLEIPDGEKIAPKTAGIAKDLMFQVQKDGEGRLRIGSRRQLGWIAKSDAVLFEQAVAYFTKRVAENPKDSHAFTARGLALMSKKESDKALADFNGAIQLDAKATLAYYHRANLAYGRGQYNTALADYNTVIQSDPEFDWAYHVRGWIYYRKKDYDKALADYETAIKLAPTETVFYRDRGNVALVRKEYDKAVADYTKSIEMDPKYAVPWLQRGKTWAAKKEYAKALADYEKAAALTANDSFASFYLTPLALFLAGCPDAKLRDGERAMEVAQKAYKLTKGPSEKAALAAAHAELGQFDEAVGWQTKAIAAAPAEEREQYQGRLKLYGERKPYRLE